METFLIALAFCLPFQHTHESRPAEEPVIRYEFTVPAPQPEVWRAWTTSQGLRTFFAPAATIELRTFGRFDIHFDPAAAAGQKGAEGNIVLAVEPERMLTTTWDAPPEFPSIRAQRTFLQILLAANADGTTRVTLSQTGFGRGPEWERVHEYFLGAWTWVAAALQHRFEKGPIDWKNVPNLLPKMEAIGGERATKWAARKR
jgi:uncharacterized protein YndB with AHSA1/START domain